MFTNQTTQVNSSYNKNVTVNSAYGLTAASYTIILLRTILCRLKHDSFKPDDYLMLFAMILYAINTAVYPIVVWNGNNMTVKNPTKLTQEQMNKIIMGSKWLLIGRPFYMSYLWTLKTCILIYYTRLTNRARELIAVKLTAGLLAVTWVANMLSFFLECRPIYLYWQVLPEVPQCAKALVAVGVAGATNILTDLIIIAIPFPIIARIKLPLKRKLEIAGVFLVGFFVIIVSILRILVVFIQYNEHNKLIWGQLECFAATVVANTPIIHGLYRHAWMHIRKGRLGNRVDTPTIQVRRATSFELTPDSEIATPQPLLSPEDQSGIGKSFRRGVKRMNDKIRKSFGTLEIQTQVELVQEISSKVCSETPKEGVKEAMEAFMPHASGPTAHISTEISKCSHDTTNGQPTYLSRFRRCPKPFVSLAGEK